MGRALASGEAVLGCIVAYGGLGSLGLRACGVLGVGFVCGFWFLCAHCFLPVLRYENLGSGSC